MNIRFKNRNKRKERQFYTIKLALFFCFFSLFSTFLNAQDSIPEKVDVAEESKLKFQQFFFQALSQKSIGNFQKAIENLESCNQILENDVAVYFEFSKNYLELNNFLLAEEYVKRALAVDKSNIWMLKHLVAVHQKNRNFKKAIEVQQEVVTINAKEREYLVRLYLQNRQYDEAISLMNLLEKEGSLSARLKKLRTSLENRKEDTYKVEKLSETTSLIERFSTDKSYKTLEQILKISEDKPADLLKFSEEGIALFPAQPYVYLMNAKALNYQKEYQKAVLILKNGIDFVIEDKMEASFYLEMAIAYKGLGNSIEEEKYTQKAKKLKS